MNKTHLLSFVFLTIRICVTSGEVIAFKVNKGISTAKQLFLYDLINCQDK
jgi:hypothetical protein